MEELFKDKMSLLKDYFDLSTEHANVLKSDDLARLGGILKKKDKLIQNIGKIDEQLSGYRRQDALPLVGGICDLEKENIRLTKVRMNELRQHMQDIDKRKTMIDRYTTK